MKKALVFLMILAVAGGAFAQINWSGEAKFGLTVKVDTNEKAHAESWHDDGGSYVRFGGSVDQGDWGFSGGFKVLANYAKWDVGSAFGSDGSVAKVSDVILKNKFVVADGVSLWGYFLDKMIKVTAGETGSNWGSGGMLDTSTGDADIQVNVTPMEGLNFGFTLGDRSWSGDPGRDIDKYFQEIGVGVKYSADLFDVAAGFRGKKWSLHSAFTDNGQLAYLGFVIKQPIEGLTIDGGGKALRLGDQFGKLGIFEGDIRVEYKISILTARAGFGAILFTGSDLKNAKGDALKLGFRVPIYIGVQVIDGLYFDIDASINNDYGTDLGGEKEGQEYMKITIPAKLAYTYKFGDTASMTTFYKFTDTYSTAEGAENSMAHQFTVNFGFSF